MRLGDGLRLHSHSVFSLPWMPCGESARVPMEMILGSQQISLPALARLPCVAGCQRAGVLRVVGPGAACHCCQASEPPAAPGGLPGHLTLSTPKHCWEHPSYTGAVSRNTGRGHRGGLCGSVGRRRRTHSTFLRETFWLGRVAETVM